MMKRILCFILTAIFLVMGMTGLVLADDSALFSGNVELFAESKLKDDFDYYLLNEAVVGGEAVVDFKVEICSDDMYGATVGFFNRSGFEFTKLNVSYGSIGFKCGEAPAEVITNSFKNGSKLTLTINLDSNAITIKIGDIIKTIICQEQIIDVAGFRVSPGGHYGIGFRHVIFSGFKVFADENAEVEENISEPPLISEKIVLEELFREDFSSYKTGESINPILKIATEGENNYLVMNTNIGDAANAHRINLPKEYKNDIFTFSFDYFIEKNSEAGFQLQLGACLNFMPTTASADQEKLNPSNRNVNIAPPIEGLESGKWYNVKLVIDTEKQMFDVYYNEEKTAAGVRFRSDTVKSLTQIFFVPNGGTATKVRHLRIDNLALYRGGFVTSSDELAQLKAKAPTVKKFDTTKDVSKMKGAFAFVPGNPYMLMSDERALYDCFDNSLVPVMDGERLLIPKALVHEVITDKAKTIFYNGTEYCEASDIAEKAKLKLSVYDDMYIISKYSSPFSDTEGDLVSKVRLRFPEVLKVEKPLEYDFKTLFNNDMTGVRACSWPAKSEVIEDEYYDKKLIEMQVDETAEAGVDVQILAAWMGSVQIWKGRNYPIEEHTQWIYENYGVTAKGVAIYPLRGGDLFEDFINRCKLRNTKAFLSVRVNDSHHLDSVNSVPNFGSITKFYAENPNLRIDPTSTNWHYRVLNWKYPEVRQMKLNTIRDICENYDIDGLELDFLRHYNYFSTDVSFEERQSIMESFIKDVRKILDNTSIDGKYRYLSVRIEDHCDQNLRLGVNLNKFANAGVDVFACSTQYDTSCQGEIAEIKSQIGDKFLAVEITNCADTGDFVASGGDGNLFTRSSREMLYTTAHRALKRGADGVYAFNFQYYREAGQAVDIRGPFGEPPFDVFENITNMEFLEKQQKHYWISTASSIDSLYRLNPALPKKLYKNKKIGFVMDIAVPENGFETDGKLRFSAKDAETIQNAEFKVVFNGTELEEISDTSLTYETEYTQNMGSPENYRAYIVPKNLIVEGDNYYSITMLSDVGLSVEWTDILIK